MRTMQTSTNIKNPTINNITYNKQLLLIKPETQKTPLTKIQSNKKTSHQKTLRLIGAFPIV